MATASRSDGEELRILTCLKGLFDDEIVQILQKIETTDILDVEDEMTERFDKDELRSLREKLFILAKEKLICDIENNTCENLPDDVTTGEPDDQSQSYAQCVGQWEAVNRRAKHTLASDSIHFLMFITGRTTKFPTKLVSPASLDKVSLVEEPTSEELLIRLSKELDKSPGPVECSLVYKDESSERYTISLPLSDGADPLVNHPVVSTITNSITPVTQAAVTPSINLIDNDVKDNVFLDTSSETESAEDSASTSDNEYDSTLSRLHESLQDGGPIGNDSGIPYESSAAVIDVTKNDTVVPRINPIQAVATQSAENTYEDDCCLPLPTANVGLNMTKNMNLDVVDSQQTNVIEDMQATIQRVDKVAVSCDTSPASITLPNEHTPVLYHRPHTSRDYGRTEQDVSKPIRRPPSPVLFSEPIIHDDPDKSIDLPITTPVGQEIDRESGLPIPTPVDQDTPREAVVPNNVPTIDCQLNPSSSISGTTPRYAVQPPGVSPASTRTGCRGYCENCGLAILLWECYNSRNSHKPSRTIQTSTEDLEEHIEMSDRQNKREARDRPVTRREFEEYAQNVERRICGNTQRVDEVMGWKAMIQSHVDTLENSFVKSESIQIAQQKEICDKLEALRLMEVEKSTKANDRPTGKVSGDTRTSEPGPRIPQPQRTRPGPGQAYDSIWNIEPDENCNGALCKGYVNTEVRVPSSTPVPNRAVDRQAAMAGAKALARRGMMDPEQKPQRSQGVAFFTPRPAATHSRPKPRGDDNNMNDRSEQPTKGASGPSGLRRATGDAGKGVLPAPIPTRQPSTKQRTTESTRGTSKPNNGPTPGRSSFDLSGMTNSWYDKDSDGAGNGDTCSNELVDDNGISNPAAKQRKPRNDADPPRNGRTSDSNGARQRWDDNPYELPDPSIIRRREEEVQARRNNNNNGELYDVEGDRHDSSKEEDRSFADVAANMKWLPVLPKKRKRERSGNKPIPQLRGVSTTSRMEIYVQGLDYSLCNSHAEFEEIVYAHCRSKGVTIVDACTIPKQKSRTEAGCKVTVRASDYQRLLDMSFWPDGSTVRKWVPKSRGGRRDQDGHNISE